MTQKNISIYLSNHMAGSVSAIKLLIHLEAVARDADAAAARTIAQLRQEIEVDQKELKRIMKALNVEEGRPKQAAAWLFEKLARVKLWTDSSPKGPLFWLQSFEVLATGIEGKKALWTALQTKQMQFELDPTKLGRLNQRAIEQREIVEALRIDAARKALGETLTTTA